ncbi:hypothetical protein [Aureimonas altamirensis]|jgi:hypothetical protein|nr:hypothetical protein [Aureimonas altamirensis]
MGEKSRGSKEARKPKKVKEKVIAAAPSLKGGISSTQPAKKK